MWTPPNAIYWMVGSKWGYTSSWIGTPWLYGGKKDSVDVLPELRKLDLENWYSFAHLEMAEAADKYDKDCQYLTDHSNQSSAKYLEICLFSSLVGLFW